MICAQQKIVFAARPRKHRGEFGVTSRSAKRHDAADHPEQDQRETGIDGLNLKAEAGENADANHVGDDYCCGRERRNTCPNTIAEVQVGQLYAPPSLGVSENSSYDDFGLTGENSLFLRLLVRA